MVGKDSVLAKVELIQGGMGVYVSKWQLASAVARERLGVTAGTVSGTGLDVVHTRLLQLGDPGGHTRRALEAFDSRFQVGIGKRIIDRYHIPGGKEPNRAFKLTPIQSVKTLDGSREIPPWTEGSTPIELTIDEGIIELLVACGFAEVWLAKEGHTGIILINFLMKMDLPLMYLLYGAILAGVDGVVIGAGNPAAMPAIVTGLARHQRVDLDVKVLYQGSGESFRLIFDPGLIADGRLTQQPVTRPTFLAIVSHTELVQVLAGMGEGAPDGFIIEHNTAGGHNANPMGMLKKDELGQPIYGDADEPDMAIIAALGIPFWLAGGNDSAARLAAAKAIGARGIQLGSIFALADESGLTADYRDAILARLQDGDDAALVRTATYSPTGFAFKVVQLPGTVADDKVYQQRRRVCDIGGLTQRVLSKPDEDGVRHLLRRCPAESVEAFVAKRGLEFKTTGIRCLCNGLLTTVGLGQMRRVNGDWAEEPAVVTLGNNLEGIRRLSQNGKKHYQAAEVVRDILA